MGLDLHTARQRGEQLLHLTRMARIEHGDFGRVNEDGTSSYQKNSNFFVGLLMSPDWGSVPAWVSGVLTSGSLGLGFYILLRDRRKEEKEQAALLSCWIETSSKTEGKIFIHNASDRPLTYLCVASREVGDGYVGYDQEFVKTLLPGGEMCELPFNTQGLMQDAEKTPYGVSFTDANSITWVRDIRTGRLERVHRFKRRINRPQKSIHPTRLLEVRREGSSLFWRRRAKGFPRSKRRGPR